MKHIKPFNEALDENFREELKDFCETNLAYLLDEGRLLIEKSITLIRVQLSFDRDKDWDEIKDHMIPFLIRLTNKYEVIEKTGIGKINTVFDTENVDVYIFTRENSGGPKTEFRIKDLIDDTVEISSIEQIRFFLPRNTQVEESKSEIKKELGDNNYYQMVSGIIDILKKVKDKENRMEIANDMVKQFKRENIKFDYKKFLDELE
jgi:hypothetical protein